MPETKITTSIIKKELTTGNALISLVRNVSLSTAWVCNLATVPKERIMLSLGTQFFLPVYFVCLSARGALTGVVFIITHEPFGRSYYTAVFTSA